jgi:hypothetical protein
MDELVADHPSSLIGLLKSAVIALQAQGIQRPSRAELMVES